MNIEDNFGNDGYYTLAEIKMQKGCPEWLKSENIIVSNEKMYLSERVRVTSDADFSNIKVEVMEECIPNWIDGVWYNGIWKDGYWKNGILRGKTSEESLKYFLASSSHSLVISDAEIKIVYTGEVK